MYRTISGSFPVKKALVFLACLTIVSLISVNSASAGIEFIKADEGGTVELRRGVYLEIPSNSLKENTIVFAHMWYWKRADLLVFWFGPSGTRFRPSAKLHIPLNLINGDPDEVVFYNENGKPAKSRVKGDELIVNIPSFSYYYVRRR